MSEKNRSGDWQVIGAVALIVVGVLLLLNRVGGPWWDLVRGAFEFAFEVAWPVAVIALGVLLLISARRGGFKGLSSGERRLYRSRTERMLGGVLGGLAAYLGVDPTWVRIIYVVITVLTGFGPAAIVYIIALVLVPEEPKVQDVTWSPVPPVAPAPPAPAPPAPPAPAPPAPPVAPGD